MEGRMPAEAAEVKVGHFHGALLGVAFVCALALAGLTAAVYLNPVMDAGSWDAALARAIQGVDVGPLGSVFSIYQQIGGPYAIVMEAVVFAVVLALNWRAWRLPFFTPGLYSQFLAAKSTCNCAVATRRIKVPRALNACWPPVLVRVLSPATMMSA